MRQPGLFPDLPVRDLPLNDLEARYRRWLAEHPDVWRLFRRAMAAQCRQRGKISAVKILQALRKRGLGVPNNHVPYIVRDVLIAAASMRRGAMMRGVRGEES